MSVRIGLGNGLVLSGNKPLPEPMLTEIYVAIWWHLATMINKPLFRIMVYYYKKNK